MQSCAHLWPPSPQQQHTTAQADTNNNNHADNNNNNNNEEQWWWWCRPNGTTTKPLTWHAGHSTSTANHHPWHTMTLPPMNDDDSQMMANLHPQMTTPCQLMAMPHSWITMTPHKWPLTHKQWSPTMINHPHHESTHKWQLPIMNNSHPLTDDNAHPWMTTPHPQVITHGQHPPSNTHHGQPSLTHEQQASIVPHHPLSHSPFFHHSNAFPPPFITPLHSLSTPLLPPYTTPPLHHSPLLPPPSLSTIPSPHCKQSLGCTKDHFSQRENNWEVIFSASASYIWYSMGTVVIIGTITPTTPS